MWNKRDETPDDATTTAPSPRPAAEERRSSSAGGGRALIGESVRVEGTISGSEDLLIDGEVEGTVKLQGNSVTVGRGGRVKADIHGRVLVVEGNVQGDLFAGEQAVVRASGEVRGNITSPRVSLEDGAKFKGSIDMEPKRASSAAESRRESVGGSRSSSSGGDSASKSGGKDESKGGAASAGGSGAAASGGGSGSGGATASAGSGSGSSGGSGSGGSAKDAAG